RRRRLRVRPHPEAVRPPLARLSIRAARHPAQTASEPRAAPLVRQAAPALVAERGGDEMNIARFSVTRPVAVTMRIASLVLLGIICLTKLPVDLLPRVSYPTLAVITTWPNVAPEEMETQIT